MASCRFDLAVVSGNVLFGKTNSRIVASGADLQVRNNANTLFANLSVLDPTIATHAATKAYVDNLFAVGISWKQTVRLCSQVNVNIASAPALIDGVSPANGDRIALEAQTTASQNGLWVYNGAGNALTRPADWATGSNQSGSAFFVREGTCAEDGFVATADPAVVDTNDPVLVQFASTTPGVSSVTNIGAGTGLVANTTGAVTVRSLTGTAQIGITSTATEVNIAVNANSIAEAQLASGVRVCRRQTFAFNTASPFNVGAALTANSTVLSTRVHATTPFSSGATLTVGTAGTPNLLQDTTHNDLTTTDICETANDETFAVSTQIIGTIGGAPAAGAGVVYLDICL